MRGSLVRRRSPERYFVLLFVLSIPFLVFGTVQESWLPRGITINLPSSALMFVCPVLAASVLRYHERGWVAVREQA